MAEIKSIEGIIIGDRVQIGDNCNIYQHVTLGQKNGQYPIIGNNVTMYPGCVIIGGITVGDNVVVAPNAVVIQDVPADTIVGGIPAHIIKRL